MEISCHRERPPQEPCPEKQEITESIRAVIDQVISLHRREIQAVHRGDVQEVECIQEDLKEAMTYEASLIEKLHAHLKAHGCNALKALQ